MRKLKKWVAGGLAAVVLGLPFAVREEMLRVHTRDVKQEETEYLCGGWMYDKQGHRIGLQDHYAPKAQARRIMDFQRKAEELWNKYGDGSKELQDFLEDYEDMTVDGYHSGGEENGF